jgi:hypothetical protein
MIERLGDKEMRRNISVDRALKSATDSGKT